MAKKNQKTHVLAFLASQDGLLKLSDIARQVGNIPERTLRRWLVLWCEEGVLDRSGGGRSTRYRYIGEKSNDVVNFRFLQSLDNDLQQVLLHQIRDLWTHHSTALEGNTLTLGDTHFILAEGLTISGKPVKDHQEVVGHARAIDLVYQSLSQPLSAESLFALHRAVQTEAVNDIYKPQGDWKLEPNGTYAVNDQGHQCFIQYALPAYVPVLMDELLAHVNSLSHKEVDINNAHEVYAKLHMGFVHIHPFWDGNGRMARLIANIPLLKAGLPPLVIPADVRRQYIEFLSRYQLQVGQLDNDTGVWPQPEKLEAFSWFCESSYRVTRELVENAYAEQKKRAAN
jgi:Fic family protein